MSSWVKFINISIKHIESIGVPKCAHKLALTFNYGFAVESVRKPRSRVGVEIPSDCVGAVAFKCIKRVNCVAL